MLSVSSVSELYPKALEIFSVLAENTKGELKCAALFSHFQIPYGKKYDKTWLLSMIQSKCSVPFNPIEVR